MRTSAAIARQSGAPLELCSVDLAEPLDDEVVVRLVAAAVAQCDLDAIAGRLGADFPFVPGTEAAGIVERCGGQVHHLQAGDAVVLGFTPNERSQERRSDGTAAFAEAGGPINGFIGGQSCFATHILCRTDALIAVANDDPLELLAPVCGELLIGAAPFLTPGAAIGAVVIAGASFAGLSAIVMAKSLGAEAIILFEPNKEHHPLASELGATVIVEASEEIETATRSLHADGARLALIYSDAPGIVEACRASLASDGTTISGMPRHADLPGVQQATNLVDKAVMVPQLLVMQRTGVLRLEKLIDFFPFEKINDAIDAAAAAHVTKAVVRFQLGAFGELDRALETGAAAEKEEPDGQPAEPPAPELDGDVVMS